MKCFLTEANNSAPPQVNEKNSQFYTLDFDWHALCSTFFGGWDPQTVCKQGPGFSLFLRAPGASVTTLYETHIKSKVTTGEQKYLSVMFKM